MRTTPAGFGFVFCSCVRVRPSVSEHAEHAMQGNHNKHLPSTAVVVSPNAFPENFRDDWALEKTC